MVGARRVGTTVAVGAIGKAVAVIVLVVAAFRFRHNGTIGSRPAGRAFAAKLLLVVDPARFAVLKANASVVSAITETSICNRIRTHDPIHLLHVTQSTSC